MQLALKVLLAKFLKSFCCFSFIKLRFSLFRLKILINIIVFLKVSYFVVLVD